MADLEWRRSRFQRSACQRQSVARRAVVSRETADRDGRRPARTTEGVHQPGARRVDCEAHWNAAGLDSRSALWGRPSSQAAMFRGAELSDTGGSPSGGRLAIRCGSGGLRDERSMRGSLFHVKRPHTPVRWRAPTAFPWTERRPLHVQAASTMALCLSPRNYLASMLGDGRSRTGGFVERRQPLAESSWHSAQPWSPCTFECRTGPGGICLRVRRGAVWWSEPIASAVRVEFGVGRTGIYALREGRAPALHRVSVMCRLAGVWLATSRHNMNEPRRCCFTWNASEHPEQRV